MGTTMNKSGAFFATAARRMGAPARGAGKNSSGGLFETRLHGSTVDVWQHRVSVPSVGEAQQRGMVTAKWLARAGKQNIMMGPWGAVGLLVGYFAVQDALPDSFRIF